MPKYLISYGTTGQNEYIVVDCDDSDEAWKIAYEMACEVYDSVAGLHGVPDERSIAEENGLDIDNEDDVEEISMYYSEERESWLNYDIELFDEEKHKDYL